MRKSLTPRGPQDLLEKVQVGCRLRSARALEELWREYPDEDLWGELVRVLAAKRRPTFTFVRAYLADHAKRRDHRAKIDALIASRTGKCSGCGALNCPGEDWDRCPHRRREGK